MKKLLIVALLSLACWRADAQTCGSASSTTATLNGSTVTLMQYPMFFGASSCALGNSLQDTSSTGKANSANPPYAIITSTVPTFISGGYNWTGSLSEAANMNNLATGAVGESTCVNAALAWWAQGAPSGDPNGYLALAKRCVDHIEEYMDGALGCDTTQNVCGRAGSQDADWAGAGLYKMAFVYDIVHSQLSGTEITNFANKILNDNTAANGGIDTVACTPQPQTLESGTISVSSGSPTVTGSGTNFSGYAVGGVLIAPGGVVGSSTPSVIGFISSVNSSTSITLTANSLNTYPNGTNPGGTFYYSPPWNSNCGFIWYFKHMQMAPLLTPTQATYYVANGSQSTAGPVFGSGNLTWPQVASYMALGFVLAQDDSRAQTLLTQSYNYYLTQEHNFALTSFEGPPEEGASYPHSRQASYTPLILAMLQNAVVSPPAIGGTLTKRWAQEFYLAPLPYSTVSQSSFGSPYGDRYYQFASGPDTFEPLASYLLSGTNEGKYLTYFAQQTTGNGGRGDYVNGDGLSTGRGTNAPVPFIYMTSPANTSQWTDYRTLPTQFIFNQSDLSTCTSLSLTCSGTYNAGPAGTQYITPPIYQFMFSKSDWTTTATEVQTYAGWSQWGFDHMLTAIPGNIKIYRNAPLLTGDGSCNNYTTNDTCDYADGLNDSVIMPGTFGVNNFGGYSVGASNANYASVARWASTEPTGDSSSRYAYEMIDATQAYNSTANPTRVQRSIIHFKKASLQDYVIVYDDVAVGTAEPIYIFNHYAVGCNTGGSPCEGTIANTTNSVTLTRTGVARLVTDFLPVGSGTFFLTNEGDNYSGSSGLYNTDRVNICGSISGSACNNSATSMEAITVHLPSTNTSATMPTLTQPSCTATGGNCAAVQIADSSGPKVAAFARQGATLTHIAFTTTHSGTAQYLVAGMTPGSYTGTDGSGSLTCVVNANDNTCYFESVAGTVSIGAGGASGTATVQGVTIQGATIQ